jgi:hypothetical protein
MKKHHVLVQRLVTVEVVADSRDAAADAALAEVSRGAQDLTHSGLVLSDVPRIVHVATEQVDGRFA